MKSFSLPMLRLVKVFFFFGGGDNKKFRNAALDNNNNDDNSNDNKYNGVVVTPFLPPLEKKRNWSNRTLGYMAIE